MVYINPNLVILKLISNFIVCGDGIKDEYEENGCDNEGETWIDDENCKLFIFIFFFFYC